MTIDDLKTRLTQLIEKGEGVLKTKYRGSVESYVDQKEFYDWHALSLSYLSNMFGEDHIYFREFYKNCPMHKYASTIQGQSLLKAALADIEGGYLKQIEVLVSADIFSDFLEMASYLLDNGYKDPAASLIGAVLEDGLRKIAKKHNITIKTDDNINSLNQKMIDGKIYNQLQRKEVQVWQEIRDNADHGHFDSYTKDQVKKMHDDIKQFLTRFL